MTSYDAIVIGAGPNGLVAANRLADAGWSVLVLEQQPDAGGAVRSARDLHPDFIHDTFSAFYPLAAASKDIQDLALEDHGLSWLHAPAVLGHPFPDGSWGILHRDREVTAAHADAQHPGDGDAWMELCAFWDHVGEHLVDSLLTPFPPVRPLPGMLRQLRRAGGMQAVRTLLTPVSELAGRFGGRGPRALLVGNAGHADIPMDAPGSGLMGLMMTMLGQTAGFPVPRGGAGELTQALVRRLRAKGAEVRVDSAVRGIDVVGGRAHAVRTDGDEQCATRAIIACVTAPQLYGGPRPGLLAQDDVPARVRVGMRAFGLDPSTVKVDWALSGPVPWASPPPFAPGTVHVADDHAELTQAASQVAAGFIPDHPFLLAGQMTTADPSRSPAGTESFWAYTHVPQGPSRDLGDDGLAGIWDHSECERFADRVQARIETLAPGFANLIGVRRVLGPRELEARDANLVGGAINGGTSQLHQELVFRPVPGLGRAETGVKGLYLGSASAHPGGGVHGAAGMNAARAALAHDRLIRLVPKRRARRQAKGL